jgi:predicted amidophosphoribosyltransferase
MTKQNITKKCTMKFINEVELCIHCGGKRKYSDKYDAYYCPKCIYWLEKICPSRDCEYCSKHPKYPNLKEEEEWNKKNKLQ